MNSLLDICLITVVVAIFSLVTYFIGLHDGGEQMRKSAAKASVGHYVMDSETGDSKFEWISTNK